MRRLVITSFVFGFLGFILGVVVVMEAVNKKQKQLNIKTTKLKEVVIEVCPDDYCSSCYNSNDSLKKSLDELLDKNSTLEQKAKEFFVREGELEKLYIDIGECEEKIHHCNLEKSSLSDIIGDINVFNMECLDSLKKYESALNECSVYFDQCIDTLEYSVE